MRVGVVDVGSNSTRLYVADVRDGRVVAELDRRTTVTRLAEGVDASGELRPAARERVVAAVAGYRARLDELHADTAVAVLTSAVRDASNGPAFAAELGARFDLDARILRGEEEAALTFAGATSDRRRDGALVVIDVGGGSTELIVGRDGEVVTAASAQAGVVRQSERHLPTDPPASAALDALRAEARALFAEARDSGPAPAVDAGIAVAGTATTCAAILGGVEPYDPARVQGTMLQVPELEALLTRLATLDLADRRAIAGLHPDRAPVIVAGIALLLEALAAFGLRAVEVSEHDILRGAAQAVSRSNARWTGV